MARVNTARLAAQASDFALRADFVRTDPAVVKAAREASRDIAQAGRSTRTLIRESRSAWLRYEQGNL